MPRPSRLAAAAVLLAAAACADAPTMPSSVPAVQAPAVVRADSLSEPLPSGECRSGFALSNGICTRI